MGARDMPGLTTNIINLISDNLRDRYRSGFPILKELIQNADDAGATIASFGLREGLKSSRHPLLSGPALFFFNNGGFKETDKRAIVSFAENSKAGEAGTIGKFGLGMKSAFHLCEAFLYVARSDGKTYESIVNPWNSGDDNLHPDWEVVLEDDWAELRREAERFATGAKAAFLLWIPLRKQAHLRTKEGAQTGSIIERFPGDDLDGVDLQFLRDEDLPGRLAQILPLLLNLEKIEYRSNNGNRVDFEIRIDANRRLERGTTQETSTGVVSNRDRKIFIFYGAKLEANSTAASVFGKLRAHSAWPKTYYRDGQGFQKLAPDKSQPEGSVVIGHQDGVNGGLTLCWAVFLPLDEEGHVFRAAIPGSSRHYHVVLHGQFFVDAGRRGIHDFARLIASDGDAVSGLDESGLRRRWNREIADSVVLPLLLPVLAGYVSQCALPDDEIHRLTKAIVDAASSEAGTRFLTSFGGSVSRDSSWVRRVGQSGPMWTLLRGLNPSLRSLPIPPASDPGRPWKCLPVLSKLDSDRIFVDALAPRISSGSDQWTEVDLWEVLNGIAHVFDTAELLDYLVRFLEATASPFLVAEPLQNALVELCRAGFLATGVSEMRQRAATVSRLVAFVQPERRVALGTVDSRAASAVPSHVFLVLWGCKAKTLIVPKDLDAELRACGKPSNADATSWLSAIDEAVRRQRTGDLQVVPILRVATALLEEALDAESRESLLRINKHLKVLSARDAGSEAEIAVSVSDLEAAMIDGNLLGFAQGTTPRAQLGKAPALAAALVGEKVLVVASRTVVGLLDDGGRPGSAGDEASIMRSIGIRAKKLGSEAKRRALICVAGDAQADDVARRGLRYLLHGSDVHFADMQTTLWVPGHLQSKAWETLWRQVAGIPGDDAWNVLPRTLIGEIPSAQWPDLGVREIDPGQVVQEFERVGGNGVDGAKFSEGGRNEVLRFVETEKTWLSLPFHTLVTGGLCAIGDDCFLDQGLRVPAELESGIRIIARSKDAGIAGKQVRWIKRLTPTALATLALGSESPSRHWDLIMTALDQQVAGVAAIVAWLPLKQGGAIAPQDVIDLPELGEHIQRLAASASHCYASVDDLNPALGRHSSFQPLRDRYFSKGDQGLEKLALLMSAAKGYAIGALAPVANDDLIKALPALREVQALPAWQVIGDACAHFSLERVQRSLLPEVRTPIGQDVLEAVLRELAERAQSDVGAGIAFDMYLGMLATLGVPGRETLQRLPLRTKSGKWRKASTLCHGAAGIDDDYVLCDRQAALLTGVIAGAGGMVAGKVVRFPPEEVKRAAIAAPGELEKYFRPWGGLVADEHIGGLLTLFGPRVRTLAERFLGVHSHEGVLDELNWHTLSGWMHGFSAVDAFEKLEIGIDVVTGEPVAVTGILGSQIQVPLAATFDSLIVGQPWWAGTQYGGKLPVLVQVRQIPFDRFDATELSDLLRRSAEHILRTCCDQREADLGGLWDKLSSSDQLEVDVARAMLLEHLPFYLRQLGAHHYSDRLREVLDDYDRAWERLKEMESSKNPSAPDRERLDNEVRAQRQRIRDVLTTDSTAPTATLKAIRRKLRDYQYDEDSVPFELFQNADDALVELTHALGMRPSDHVLPHGVCKFVVSANSKAIRFAHWGRLVNSRTAAVRDGHELGFHRDLQKMLVLSSSDKPVGQDVTGKFGLGFKSVLLVCDRPRLLSGRMRVEIVGGVLPERWTTSQEAANWLDKETEVRAYRGTLIEADLPESANGKTLHERFSRLAGPLCVFARAIRRIEIEHAGVRRVVEWRAETMLPGVEVGTIELPTGDSVRRVDLIVFRLAHGCVAIRTVPLGFEVLPDEVPSLWVTTPTREEQKFGFAVSAEFSVDAGRGRLAGDSDQNRRLAAELGRELGVGLVGLYDGLTQDFTGWSRRLGFASSVTQAGVWDSLWNTLAAGVIGRVADAVALGREIAVQSIAMLAGVKSGIPNGLPKPFAATLDRSDVTRELTKAWANSDALMALQGVSGLSGRIGLHGFVSSEIARILCWLNPQLILPKVTLGSVVAAIERSECAPLNAQALELLYERIWNVVEEAERQTAEPAMSSLHFQSRAGSWVESRQLLCAETGDEEEKRLAAFAPGTALLDDAYGLPGKAFFSRCRPRFEVTLVELVQWVAHATSNAERSASLNYMRWGERASKLGVALRERGLFGTWLYSIDEQHPCFVGWAMDDIQEVLRQLSESVSFTQPVPDQPPPEPERLRGADAVQRIHDWWEAEGRRGNRDQYLQTLYPYGRAPMLARDSSGRIDREGWMTLLSLGVLQSIGRVRDQQNRSFLELLHDRGWWTVIATSNPRDNASAWLDILEHFADGHVDDESFSLWMDCFPRLFRLARWLDEYVEILESIDRRTPREMQSLLTPMADAALQGGGISAPAINRTLRMGQHLVIRELLRLGTLGSATAVPHAYMPSAAVREFVSELELGGDSNTSTGIYEALAGVVGTRTATFGGDFDIPLRVLARDRGLAWALLRVELVVEEDFD